jgi:hypothetical protein
MLDYTEEEDDYIENQSSDELYFFEVFNTISEDVISDEYFDKNKRLLIDMSNLLYDMNSRNDNLPPDLARRIIEGFFAAIKRNGIR